MRNHTWLLLVGVFVAGAVSSCATSGGGRSGLIDRLDEMDRASGHGDRRRSKKIRMLEDEEQEVSQAEAEKLSQVGSRLRWPLKNVQITSPFGSRGSDFHEGIDLRAASGTPVLASGNGTVLYAGQRIHGYGKMIVIRHEKGVSTVYAHNSRIFVRKGQWVRQGEKIALSGATGRVQGPHVHFEMRTGVVAVDPKRWVAHRAVVAKVPLINRKAASVGAASKNLAKSNE